jgi:hypothetical protein
MAEASGGSKSKAGTWEGVGASSGTAAHFRIYAADGTTCHMQGTVTSAGAGGDMELDNTSIAIDQAVSVNTFTISRGNA